MEQKSFPKKGYLLAPMYLNILVILGVLVLVVGGYFIYTKFIKGKFGGPKVSQALQDAISPSEYNSQAPNETDGSKEYKVYGQATGISSATNYFALSQNGSTVYVYYKNITDMNGNSLADVSIDGIVENDYIVVTGKVIKSPFLGVAAMKITKVTKEEVDELIASVNPKLEITILEYTKTLEHGCDPLKFKVKLKNVGGVPLNHKDTFDMGSIYVFSYLNNGLEFMGGYSYDESGTNIGDTGMKDFGTLEPGEEVTVDFGGGGSVIQSYYSDEFESDGSNRKAGVAGSPNIIASNSQSGGKVGENTFQLKFLRTHIRPDERYIYPINLGESNIVTITLNKLECDMTDISGTYYTKPIAN